MIPKHLDTIGAVLLLAGLAVMLALVARGWLKIIDLIMGSSRPARGRAAIRERPGRDGLVTARDVGWFVIDEEAGSWPRQWPIAGMRQWLPGDDWSIRYDADGRQGMIALRERMAKERWEASDS